VAVAIVATGSAVAVAGLLLEAAMRSPIAAAGSAVRGAAAMVAGLALVAATVAVTILGSTRPAGPAVVD
jgi:hypothetical protein